MEELRKKRAERKHSHLGVPESWEEGRAEVEEGRNTGRLRITREVERKQLEGDRWKREAGWEAGKK